MEINMKSMRSMNLSLTLGIICVLLMGFIVPNAGAGFVTYPSDGIWEDTFNDMLSVKLTNCVWKSGEIVLKQEFSQIPYTFAQKNNEAYAYQSFFFFPIGRLFSPNNHQRFELKLGDNDRSYMSTIDNQYSERSSSAFRAYIVYHFRFKIDIDTESIDNIHLLWNGNADAGSRVDFYYWNSSYLLVGGWERLGRNRSAGEDFSVDFTIPGGAMKYAVDDNHYIDISVVAAYPLLRRVCTISTNFVELLARSEKGYTLDDASAETKTVIDPTNISTSYNSFYWETLTWDDYQPAGTSVRYHILYQNATGQYVLVDNTTLPGNTQGFQTPPVYLNSLSDYEYHTTYNKLKIRVNFSTTNPSVSPRIFSWALTWQNRTKWHDSFNSYYRIDQRSKVNKVNDTIMLSIIQDEWPLFGFDSGNTRASSSKGPVQGNRYWFSGEYVGGGFRNPVVGNGKVYIFSKEKLLHVYDVVLPSGLTEGDPQKNVSTKTFEYDVVNSPAVTENLVIVATGQQAHGGSENHIYGLKTEDLNQSWDFSYGQKVCYDASPVVSGDTIYISTWGGDNDSYVFESSRYTNNKLLALDMNGQKRWDYSLPGPGFSSPAVTEDMIIVGCSSPVNDSVFALSLNGGKLWSKAVGAVGHASPVISGDTVFVTCRQVSNKKSVTKIVAMNINDGSILWNVTLGSPSALYDNVAESTPAIYNGVLYAASPDGTVYALDTMKGTTNWSNKIYPLPLFSTDVLLSSPAYADNHVYIGTPAGEIYSLDATTGQTSWTYETFPVPWTPAPVLGSPVVSNGVVFVADEYNVLYAIGRFTASTKEVKGQVVSIPIRLPETLWWDRFYADVLFDKNISGVSFTLLDEHGTPLKELINRSQLSLGSSRVLNRTIRLQANLSSKNLTRDNPQLLRWYVTLITDTQIPFLDRSTFTPDSAGWLPEIVPVFTIRVKDNTTGLRVKSAQYTLEYTLDNITQTTTAAAQCTGANGTTDWQLMTMNISALPFYENITEFHSLSFWITDLAGNTAQKIVTFKQDTKKPTSHIKEQFMKKKYNSTYIMINATSNDTGTLNVDASGIALVELYYRYSQINNYTGDWVFFTDSTRSKPTWRFNFTNNPSQPGGYYELCTIAIDNASNVEDFPVKGDIWFLWDWKAPSLPSFSGETLWFNELPQFSVVFNDDYRLDTIQYRPNFETTWTTIATKVNSSTYNTNSVGRSWSLKQDFWDQMQEGEVYYLYFRINDSLGNTLLVTDNNKALTLRKDTAAPSVSIDVPNVEADVTWDTNFTVSGLGSDRNGSGIKEALLYYRFSEDNSNWSSWSSYGDSLSSPPFEWNFEAMDGDGYYQVKINATDYASNVGESSVIDITVASFPTTFALVLVCLIVVLVFISIILFFKWRTKKEP
jgi:outer membrane protein assembly factor BamB